MDSGVSEVKGASPQDMTPEIEEQGQDFEQPSHTEKPKIGMMFNSIVEAEYMYYKYAGEKGFSVRKGSTRHSKQGLRKKTYVCLKEGS
ncbi:hypothetical protein ZOSMA_33G00800 [Zostera marina]|uniref:FAR1 domain-containing protein n=1 Tax=Zostera marina TaxID=29655 RepID=A0A0K9P7S5_ZOSMR|nr:hypothetical protein ZOSMA_33G00800 [Zostera marina]